MFKMILRKSLLLQFQKVGQLSIVRRLGIPECFLLVTQRITKYPVLVERIIQNTEETEEQSALALALTQIRDCISHVDGQVSDFENAARLRDIAQRLEPKSQCLLKDWRLFSREDLTEASRTLQNEATFTIKESSGKLKEVQALLLTDVLILLQEKDQKLAFKTMQDNKFISLQSLIVREVAHEEKAMFLICASSDNYVMYEIHTRSKAERNTWMALIRQAVESQAFSSTLEAVLTLNPSLTATSPPSIPLTPHPHLSPISTVLLLPRSLLHHNSNSTNLEGPQNEFNVPASLTPSLPCALGPGIKANRLHFTPSREEMLSPSPPRTWSGPYV
ncbi:unnamed protein product [Boreogadus saida]